MSTKFKKFWKIRESLHAEFQLNRCWSQ